jgi:hypothetical protein
MHAQQQAMFAMLERERERGARKGESLQPGGGEPRHTRMPDEPERTGRLVPDVQHQRPAGSSEPESLQTVRTAERPKVPREAKSGEALQPLRTSTLLGNAAPARRSGAVCGKPKSQGGGTAGWNERRVREAKKAKEQHAKSSRSAAELAAAERSAAERAWLARERAQGRNEKAAYARWEDGRRAWLRRGARKAARKRRKPKGCNVRMQGAAVAVEEQDATMVGQRTTDEVARPVDPMKEELVQDTVHDAGR